MTLHTSASGDVSPAMLGLAVTYVDVVVTPAQLIAAPFYWPSAIAIDSVDQSTRTFGFSGGVDVSIPAGTIIVVSGSTGNDSSYTVASEVPAHATSLVVRESIPDATGDGQFSSEGLSVEAALGDAWVLMPMPWFYTTVSDGDAWGADAGAQLYLGPIAFGVSSGTIEDALSTDFPTTGGRNSFTYDPAILLNAHDPLANLLLQLQTTNDVTAGGLTVGTRSLMYRIAYTIVPARP